MIEPIQWEQYCKKDYSCLSFLLAAWYHLTYHIGQKLQQQLYQHIGGAVAEWSKALLKREKINENQKIPGSPPGLGTFKKNLTDQYHEAFGLGKMGYEMV